MKTATLRDLRYSFPKIEAWLRAGEEIQITKHSKPFCRVLPRRTPERGKPVFKMTDFTKFRKELWGGRVFTEAEIEEARALETGEP